MDAITNDGGVVLGWRDPRDGLIDVFAEEHYAHRILWYRIDSKIAVRKQALVKGKAGKCIGILH